VTARADRVPMGLLTGGVVAAALGGVLLLSVAARRVGARVRR